MLGRLRFFARAGVLGVWTFVIVACATGQEIQDTGGSQLRDAASFDAGEGAASSTGGAEATGSGGRSASGSGGGAGDGGDASASGGDGGMQNDCSDPGQKRCGGLCLTPSPAIGCGPTGCTECASVPNSIAECNGDECGFRCNPGFVRSGSACTPGALDGSPPGCANDTQDGSETDVDCGGDCGATCEPGENCSGDSDCADGVCNAGTCGCTADTCADLGNQCGEVDDGCGGTVSCSCPSGQSCVQGTCRQDSVGGFGYAPSNFDPAGLDPPATDTTLDCGESTFDSTSLVFGNWCGQALPTPVERTQNGGPEVVVLPLANLIIASGATLRITGSRPVILAVLGNATLEGTLDANASGTTPGPGGNLSCGASQGQNGSGSPGRWPGDNNAGASGGGGGGLGTAGGRGGTSDTDGNGCGNCAGGSGGAARGTQSLTPLIGGCAGGRAGGCNTDGGAGGGAVQVSAAGTLRLSGTVRVNGGNGGTPCGAQDEGGGTGGGSGGALLLEADTLDTNGATLQANGGRGGANGAYCGVFNCGNTQGGAGSNNAGEPGGNGSNRNAGSPGGGGGYGRIVTSER